MSAAAEEMSERSPNLPVLQLVLLGSACCASCMAITSIFPYVAFQVESFGVGQKEEDTGYYVGVLGSIFMWSRTVSQMPAGVISDHVGYKPVITSSLLLLSCGTLAYGFASTFWMAVVARGLTGLFHVVLPPAKAMAGELAGSDKHRKTGMMVISASAQLGGTIGPAIGGLLSAPCEQYLGVCSEDSPLGEYQYLLPNLVLSVVFVLDAIVVGIWLKEPSSGCDGGFERLEAAVELPPLDKLQSESLGPVGRSEQDEDSAAVEEKESLTLVDRVLDGESAAAPEQQDSRTDESQPKEKEGEGEASGLRQVLSNLLNGG